MGPQAGAVLEIAGGGGDHEIPSPERAEIHHKSPLHVDKESALAFTLHDGAAFLGLEGEVALQFPEIGPVGVDAPVSPAAQTAERQHLEQFLQMVEHGPHGARGPRQHVLDKAQVLQEHSGVAQPPRGKRRGLEKPRDDGAGGPRGEAQQQRQKIGQDILAEVRGQGRTRLDPGDHRLVAAAKPRKRRDAVQPDIQGPGRQLAPRIGQGGQQRLADGCGQGVGQPRMLRRQRLRTRWRRRHREHRACPDRR